MLISWYDCGCGDINLLSMGMAKMFHRMVAACNVWTPDLIQAECSKESTIRNWECSGEKWRWSNHIQPQMLELKYRDWDKWLTVCFHRDETSLYYENRILKQSAEGDDWRYCALSWKCDWWDCIIIGAWVNFEQQTTEFWSITTIPVLGILTHARAGCHQGD